LIVRRIIFWTHLTAGTVAGAIVLIMSVTGVLLMYERQMIDWADSHFRSAPPVPGAMPMPLDDILSVVEASYGIVPTTITIGSHDGDPVQVAAGRDRIVYVDAYSGRVLGEGSRDIRRFFQAATAWHRWLGREGEGRAVGRAITGACNLAFLWLICTGAYLWFPRNWSAQQVRAVALFRGGLSGKARDFNWHNVIGLWSAIPLFLIVVSGAVISYPWASNLVYRLAGNDPPQQRGGPPPGRADSVGTRALRVPGLNAAILNARQEVKDWRTIVVRLPMSPRAPITLTIDQSHRGRPDQRVQLAAAQETGAITKREAFADYNAGRRLRSWLRWVHTGEAAGLIGQTVVGLVSAGAVILVWTGLSLSWRRTRAWRDRNRRQTFTEKRAA
jgi:uncharacterized iron-regulated membrane protein